MKTITQVTKLAEELVRLVTESPRVRRQFEKIVKPPPQQPEESPATDPDDQIRKLEVRYENDSSLEIKPPGQPSRVYDCRQLGFRNDRAKAWRFLIEVLSDPHGGFDFGTAYLYPDGNRSPRLKNKAYDARWKLCDEACKRLALFFEREFGWPLPRGYKLYEKVATGPEGRRCFKFRVRRPKAEEESRPRMDALLEKNRRYFSGLTEGELILEIQRLNDDFLISSSEENPEILLIAYETGKTRFGWSDESMRAILDA